MKKTVLSVDITTKDTITQGELVKYEKCYWGMPTTTPAEIHQANVLSGLLAGWVTISIDGKVFGSEITVEEFEKMDPRVIVFASAEIGCLYKEFTTVPKN